MIGGPANKIYISLKNKGAKAPYGIIQQEKRSDTLRQ